MRQDQATQDVAALLRARNTLLWVVSSEELRVERALTGVAAGLKMDIRFWDCVDGIQSGTGATVERLADPIQALTYVRNTKTRALYVFRDLHKWFDPQVLRSLRSLGRQLQGVGRNEARAVVLLTSSTEVPSELGLVPVIDWPLPDREEMGAILDDVLSSLDDNLREEALPKNGARDFAIDAAVGLTAEEAMNSYARSLVTERSIDPGVVVSEKKRIIARDRTLTWYEPDPRGLDAIGGLDVLKEWLVGREDALTAGARSYGLPAPKGILLVGPPGTGKSLTAKAVGTAWRQPLLQLDLGAQKSKYVGESEQNIRKALARAEGIAPCILWVDEIEKALAGSTGPQGDGGVGADALATILTWMQERAGSVFVVATANDVTSLPAALLRKGRFDALFFIDLPTSKERLEILRAALGKYGRDPLSVLKDKKVTAEIIRRTENFTGAEIDAVIPDAMFKAYKDGARPLTAKDLICALDSVVPLSSTAGEGIEDLRRWAKGRALCASSPETNGSTLKRDIEL